MFRKSAVALIVLLSGATAGAAMAQSTAKPTTPPAAQPAKSDTAHKGAMHAAKPASSANAAAKPAAKPAWSKEQIKAAQVGLVKAGLYKGDTNGVMNGATHKALKEYQKKNHLPVTGHLSDSTLAKLRAS